MLRRNLHADFLKMKGLSITLAHILIPIIASGLFLAYYSISAWNENTKIIAFYQAVGTGFPVLIGIFTANIMEQEQNAGVYQNLLTLRKKTIAFLSKVILLLIFSMFSVFLAAGIFYFGFYKISGCSIVSAGTYMMAAFIMWCGSIPLYIWQMLLAFRFGKGVSIGVGIISGLVSALMLTNLGMFVWKYIPVSWTGRLPYTYLQIALGESGAINEMKSVIPVFCVFTVITMVYYLSWASHWEGSKISE
ncbi:lantibiotic immunity ABC transporter MutG family permease subunit [Blautia obeum]|uniref:lantibiotic immunity ABC transporter MutG family permease subunit n=1 Tax=Blautia obeum TaxID=40520 RepID=UPI003D0903D5